MNSKLLKYGTQLVRRNEARRWLQTERSEDWNEILRSANGDVELASKTAEGVMLLHWTERTFDEPLRLFGVLNTAGTMMLVLAESERQARAIALLQNHLHEFDNGDCNEVTDSAARWGAGFASAVERAKGQGFSGPVERKGNHAVMGEKVFSPLSAV